MAECPRWIRGWNGRERGGGSEREGEEEEKRGGGEGGIVEGSGGENGKRDSSYKGRGASQCNLPKKTKL